MKLIPKSKKSLDMLSELDTFMSHDAGDVISIDFTERHDYPFDLSNRDFWSDKLGL